jgi:hypothetical protein
VLPVRRRTFLGLALAATPTVALVGLPTVTFAGSRPRPVPPKVTRLRVSGVDRTAALRVGGGTPLLLNAPTDTGPFSLVGVTWLPDPDVQAKVSVRTRSGGRWSAWQDLELQGEHRPDGGADVAPGLREGTAPIWVGPSDGVQVRVDAAGARRPRDVAIELVDPGSSPADSLDTGPRAVAFAEQPRPSIITRAQWGADESIRRGSPSYNATVKVGFVHHTAGSNDYTPEQAAAVVRGIYAYHVKSNGWSDIGYNYLVDRFGRAYEGRAGGLDRFVIGSHTGGFNRDTFAVSLIGNFTSVPPSLPTIEALTDVLAWKLGSAYRDPLGKAVLTSAGGGTSRFSAGTKVTFDVVSGHRDAGKTSCPGDTTYARMSAIRSMVSEKLGAGFVEPSYTGDSAYLRGAPGPVAVSARTLGPLDWTITIGDSLGNLLRTTSGATTGSERISTEWDLRDEAGKPVRAGTYVIRMTGSRDGDRALPYARQVVVKEEACRGTPLKRARCRSLRRR